MGTVPIFKEELGIDNMRDVEEGVGAEDLNYLRQIKQQIMERTLTL